jgi:hypothetical protein
LTVKLIMNLIFIYKLHFEYLLYFLVVVEAVNVTVGERRHDVLHDAIITLLPINRIQAPCLL